VFQAELRWRFVNVVIVENIKTICIINLYENIFNNDFISFQISKNLSVGITFLSFIIKKQIFYSIVIYC